MGKECGAWVSRRLWGGGNTGPKNDCVGGYSTLASKLPKSDRNGTSYLSQKTEIFQFSKISDLQLLYFALM